MVHLPVAADERLAVGHVSVDSMRPDRRSAAVSRRAASPGRSPCSMNSSDAPPPVETWSTRSARPNSRAALALSPPPTTEKPRRRRPPRPPLGCRPRSAGPRTRPSGRSRRPCRPPRSRRRTRPPCPGRCRGPSTPAGTSGRQWRTSPAGPSPVPNSPARAEDRRCRSAPQIRLPLRPSSWRRSRRRGPCSSSEAPTSWPWAARKVKHMPPPTSRVSTLSSSASITPSLSDTLAPPRTATNGRPGRLQQPVEDLDLLGQHAARPPRAGTRGGPTIEAWARWAAPKASST